MAGCIFCSIAGKTQPSHIVFEETACLAFLDARPVFPGHTLIIPRAHRSVLADVPVDEFAPIMGGAQRVSRALEEAVGAEGTFVALNDKVSQSVPHVHVHVVPRRKGDGLRGFFWPRHPYASNEEAAALAARLRAALTSQELAGGQ